MVSIVPSSLVGEGGADALSAFVTGEGSVSAEKDPSSVADYVRDTFSHKGRREGVLDGLSPAKPINGYRRGDGYRFAQPILRCSSRST
jgi:hypothetical protein